MPPRAGVQLHQADPILTKELSGCADDFQALLSLRSGRLSQILPRLFHVPGEY